MNGLENFEMYSGTLLQTPGDHQKINVHIIRVASFIGFIIPGDLKVVCIKQGVSL